MGTNTRIALAVALGYLLGRQHKLGTALAFGAAAAAGRVSQDPAALLRLGGTLLGKSPVLGQLTELSKPLTAAGKAAATGAVSKGIDSVGGRIRRRADALRASGEQAAPEKPAAPDTAEDEDEQTDRRGAEGRETERSGRDEAEVAEDEAEVADDEAEVADDEAEVTDEYDEDEEEPAEEEEETEQDEESEAPVSQRRPSDRSASAAGPRRKPAKDDLDEGAQRRVRRPDRERSNAGGAPVRRRVSKS